MLVTKGFRDVLEIGRTNRPVLYDIRTQKAPPLVPRTRAIEIDERLMFDGTVRMPLDAAEVEQPWLAFPRRPRRRGRGLLPAQLRQPGARSSRPRPLVEAARPGRFVCASHEVLPQFREYERFNTTALNAYIGPLMDALSDAA